jgi:hypothetical protein
VCGVLTRYALSSFFCTLLVHQSRHSPYLPFVHGHHGEAKVMNTAINGDGFGVGWYAHAIPVVQSCPCLTRPATIRYDNFGPEPCVFKSTIPSWNCTNLQAIAAHVQCVSHDFSPYILALCRANHHQFLALLSHHRTHCAFAHVRAGTQRNVPAPPRHKN